eukprot:CAMPEP_0119332628 /NCGR_PEP_ID=MMETSP1333-20130426/83197_1 /TAXON_ID=418940 /ORGANISM="Scyphosphaera apsteinii, Strain RCC1455" /LENGTH=164 /DNA_ID=CAMNT_0007342493 /DNA_START=36 /DNA_END=526 /DNA_ORIENTATION=+
MLMIAAAVLSSEMPPRCTAVTDHISRRVFGRALGGGVCTCCSAVQHAAALATLVESRCSDFDGPRNPKKDASFARSMVTGMKSYEAAVALTKERLFKNLLSGLPARDSVIVEVGMGSFPNAPFFTAGPPGMDIIGVDPNDQMAHFAGQAAKRAGLTAENGHSVR